VVRTADADADLERAFCAFRAWQSADLPPAAAVLRHPVRRLLATLDIGSAAAL
jgi:hypothetical protein